MNEIATSPLFMDTENEKDNILFLFNHENGKFIQTTYNLGKIRTCSIFKVADIDRNGKDEIYDGAFSLKVIYFSEGNFKVEYIFPYRAYDYKEKSFIRGLFNIG